MNHVTLFWFGREQDCVRSASPPYGRCVQCGSKSSPPALLGFAFRSPSRTVPHRNLGQWHARLLSDPLDHSPWPALSVAYLSRVIGSCYSNVATARSALFQTTSFSLHGWVARMASCSCRKLELVYILYDGGPRRVWTYVNLRKRGEAAGRRREEERCMRRLCSDMRVVRRGMQERCKGRRCLQVVVQ